MLDRIRERYELGSAHADLTDLYEALDKFDRRHGLEPLRLRPQDSVSLRRESEREPVRETLKRFEDLSGDLRRQLPALRLGLARMRVVSGDLEGGLTELRDLAENLDDASSLHEVRLGLLAVALDQGKEDVALEMIRHIAGTAFEHLDFISLLGSGFAGSSWLCREKSTGRALVLKCAIEPVLDALEIQRNRERQLLRESEHPALELPDPEWGKNEKGEKGEKPEKADLFTARHWTRPYMAGIDLHQRILRDGPLASDAWLPIAWTILSGLRDMHARGLLHRALCPSHVILPARPEGVSTNFDGVEAILIDAGEVPRRTLIHALMANGEAHTATRLGRAAIKRVPFMGPESTGRPKGTSWFGPSVDIYSFGMLGWFALTGSATPTPAQKSEISDEWRSILEHCTEWIQARRPQSVEDIIALIRGFAGEETTLKLENALKIAMKTRAIDQAAVKPEDPELQARLGRTMVRLEEIPKGIAAFDEAIRLKPDQGPYHFGRGLARLLQGNIPAAIEDLELAAKLEPDRAETHANLGSCLTQANRVVDAIAAFDKALALVPGNPVLLCDRANALLQLNRTTEALAGYAQAAKTEPGLVRALSGQARCLHALGKAEEASTLWDKALAADGDSPQIYLERAHFRFENGKIDAARRDLETGMVLGAPIDSAINLAFALHKSGRNDFALDTLAAALAQHPESKPLRILQGEIFLAGSRWQEALAAIEPVLETGQDSAMARHVAGTALARLGRIEEALLQLNKGLELDGQLGKSRFQRGIVYAELRDFEAAAADFAKLVQDDANDVSSRANHATALSDLGRYAQAESEFEEALKRAPNDPQIRLGIARLYALKNQKDLALTQFDRVLADDPQFIPAIVARGQTRFEMGLFDLADEDFSKAIELNPAQASHHGARGALRASRGQLAEALVDLDLAHALDPSRSDILQNRAMARQASGRLDEALQDYDTLVAMRPLESSFWFGRATCLIRFGRNDEAMASLAGAIELDPTVEHYRLARAELHLIMNQPQQALEDLDLLTNLLTNKGPNPQVQQKRAQALSRLGNHAEALREGEEALALAPDDPRMLNNQAWILATCPEFALRNPERARDLALRCAEITSEKDPGVLDTLAVAEAVLGNFPEAIRRMEQALALIAPNDHGVFRKRLERLQAGIAYDPADDVATPAASLPPPEPEAQTLT